MATVLSGAQVSPSGEPGPSAPLSEIWAVRQRSYNAIGNPNFEIDQRAVGTLRANVVDSTFAVDRWRVGTAGTMRCSVQQMSGEVIVAPGTNFRISNNFLRTTLTTAQASLGATDSWALIQKVEGTMFRQLSGDVHSISLLVRSSVANLKFSIVLRDVFGVATKSFVHLCSLGAANTWTLITVPNIPVWPSGSWSVSPANLGYLLNITLASGATYSTASTDTWLSGNFNAATTADNFASKAVSSTFDVAFVQHEPGPDCTSLIDVPWSDNLNGCMRYYQKSYNYAYKPGSVITNGECAHILPAGGQPMYYIAYKVPMIVQAAPTGYSSATGTANRVRDVTPGNVDRGVNFAYSVGEMGFGGFNINGPNAAVWVATFQYDVDLDW